MSEPRKPLASALALLVGSSAGCFALGVFYLAGDKSKALNQLLSIYPPSGALSGVLVFGALVWLLCWAVLLKLWSRRVPSTSGAVTTATLLMLGALLLTFPPFVRML